MKVTQSNRIYIDQWCARNVRKVYDCRQCLHYHECLEKGESLAPRAIEHKDHIIKSNAWWVDEDDDDEE